MPDKKLTYSEIVKALEHRIKDLPCIHEKYEPACGIWCEHLHMWCIDFNNKSLKEKCSEYKPCCSMSLEKQTLDLINRLQAENRNLKYDYDNLQRQFDEIYQQFHYLSNVEIPYLYSFTEDKDKKLETIANILLRTKTEAYKEFAERLKQVLYNDEYILIRSIIDNLSKELVGETNV